MVRAEALSRAPQHPPTSSLLFLPACNPNACRASGRGLQPKGVRVKEVADFKVFTKGAGSGELKVTVKGPSEYQGPGPWWGVGELGGKATSASDPLRARTAPCTPLGGRAPKRH